MSKVDELIQELCPDGVERPTISEAFTLVKSPKGIPRSEYQDAGTCPVVDQGKGLVAAYVDFESDDQRVLDDTFILFGDHTREVKWIDFPFVVGADGVKLLQPKIEMLPKYGFFALSNLDVKDLGYSRHWKIVKDLRIPLPPLEIQEEIVRILDQFVELDRELEEEIAGREKQLQNVLWSLMESVDIAKVETLGSISGINTGQAMSKKEIEANPGEYPVINSGIEPLGYISKWNTDSIPIGVTSRGANVGHVSWTEGKFFRGPLNYGIDISQTTDVSPRFLFYSLLHNQEEIHNLCTHQGIPALNKSNLSNLPVPLPPLEVQEEIATKLDTITEYIDNLKRERELRQKQYEYYRDQLLDFEVKE